MDTQRRALKRRCHSSAVEFAEALRKRLYAPRLSLLARMDASAAHPSLAKRSTFQEEASLHKALPFSSVAPGVLSRELVEPLSRARHRRSMSAPTPGKRELWDVSRLEAPPESTRANPLSYLEYLSWLQQVLPKSMQPAASGIVPEPKEKEVPEGALSALELLKRLSVADEPPCLARRGGVLPLTDEEKELAERGLDEGIDGEILVSRFNVELTRKQLACLKPGQWLNDEVINFYCKLLEERGKKQSDSPKCWFPNSFFWPKLSGPDNNTYSYKDVKRWTIKAKIDIFELDHILFPMNIGESHWALGAIDLRSKGFRYFDSMFCRPHRNFVPFLQKYLQDEHKAKKAGKVFEGVEDWDLIIPDSPVPQQNNGYDCGVFTCNFAECFSSGRELEFSQDDMPSLRLRLAARVMRGTEDWE